MHDMAKDHDTRSWWQAVRGALRGTTHDYTTGAIGRSIFLLAIPMVLEMIMESLFALSDVFFVARLGASAVATVGLTESMMIVVYTIAMGLAIAGTAVVARRVGERDAGGAARAAVQMITLGLIASVVIGAVGALAAPALLRAMGATNDVLTTGTMFTRVLLGGSGTAFLLFVINAAFRGAGDAAVSMRVLWLANAINIVLGPLLIFGVGPFPELGVTGAAIATTVGRGIRSRGPEIEYRFRVGLLDENKRDGQARAEFTTTLPKTGRYRIAAAYATVASRATNVPVQIKHADGTTTVKINQRKKDTPFAFTPVGDYRFTAGEPASVIFTNTGVDGHVQIDTVRWLWLGD